MSFVAPPNLSDTDEFRHAKPARAGDLLYGDTLWVSVVDPKAGIHGVIHFHLTNNGFARYESLFVIDGVVQLYGNKIPMDPEPDRGPWSDGRLTYTVIEPWNHLHITFDWEAFGFDLDFRGRFAPFDYADCLPNGDPLARVGPFHGGHYEQAMTCRGSFEIRRGPNAGDVRQIDCFSHRDHSWSDRFASPPQWRVPEAHIASHYWPSIQLPDRHINVFGSYFENELPPEQKSIGGFVSDEAGSRPLLNATAKIFPDDGSAATRSATAFRYSFTLPDGEVIHVRSTQHHGTIQLWLRGENDLENRLDCYEAFCDFEVEETGEVGTGTAEYSVMPVFPQWKA
ncbi:MAG: hypothetical protein JRH10_10835 [Deltaproteobacteria bacterium]|nr:hypothetical protein [Deltaproteobacteria bacterium]